MKTGRTIEELAKEIMRRASAKKDFVVPTSLARMQVQMVGKDPVGEVDLAFGNEGFRVNGVAHDQIGLHTQIPAAYYDRMLKDAPDLLVTNVNRWFDKYPAERMVRTLDGTARAFLSDRYRAMENEELAEAILPVLAESGAVIMSCEVTDRRLYIKAVDQRVTLDVPTGRAIGDGSHVFFDTVSPGLVFSNSEVGFGALSVTTAIYTRMCTNLATVEAAGSLRKYHIGGKQEVGDDLYRLLSDSTRRLDNAATFAKVRDIAKAAFDKDRLADIADKHLKPMVEAKIVGDVVKVVDLTGKRFGFNEGEKKSVLQHLAAGGDLTRYGLFNAVTRTAQDLEDYDRASDFERFGGKLIELPANDWKAIAEAA